MVDRIVSNTISRLIGIRAQSRNGNGLHQMLERAL